MLSDNKNMESIGKLFSEFKKYLELQKEFVKLDAAEKMTVILSATIITAVMILLSFIILMFLSFALAYYLGDTLHNLPLGFCITGGIVLFVACVFYFNRNRFVIQPLARFMTKLILKEANGTHQ